MDIDKLYGVDSDKASEGIWLNVGDARFHCRYFNPASVEVQKVRTKLLEPYRKLVSAGMMPPEREREVSARVFARCALIGWEAVRVGGEEIAYSEDAAVALFVKFDRLFIDLATDATATNMFQLDTTSKN